MPLTSWSPSWNIELAVELLVVGCVDERAFTSLSLGIVTQRGVDNTPLGCEVTAHLDLLLPVPGTRSAEYGGWRNLFSGYRSGIPACRAVEDEQH